MEETRKRAHADADGGDGGQWKKSMRGREPLLKLLIPNTVAGVIIGKGGAQLTELKNKYGGYIRLSGHKEYYPGTEERICILTGKVSEITDLNNYIQEKSSEPGRDQLPDYREEKTKIVLTNNGAGMVIGKKGATMKGIQQECRVKIMVADSIGPIAPNERVLTISGSLEQRKDACKKINEIICSEETNMANIKARYGPNPDGVADKSRGAFGTHDNAPLPQDYRRGYGTRNDIHLPPPEDHSVASSWGRAAVSQMADSFGEQRSAPIVNMIENAAASLDKHQILAALTGAARPTNQPKSRAMQLKSSHTVDLEVPITMVGHLMGKQGQTIKEMVRQSQGAKFAFADKDTYDNSDVRTLTIKGNYLQVTSAYEIVHDKLEEYQQFDTMYQENY